MHEVLVVIYIGDVWLVEMLMHIYQRTQASWYSWIVAVHLVQDSTVIVRCGHASASSSCKAIYLSKHIRVLAIDVS